MTTIRDLSCIERRDMTDLVVQAASLRSPVLNVPLEIVRCQEEACKKDLGKPPDCKRAIQRL